MSVDETKEKFEGIAKAIETTKEAIDKINASVIEMATTEKNEIVQGNKQFIITVRTKCGQHRRNCCLYTRTNSIHAGSGLC